VKALLHDPDLGDLTDDRLTRDVRILQRAKGHRFSSDDVATAWVAARTAPDARRIADLGCGIGSVLLHLAWSLPEATLVGVEAQAISFALLERNVERNALGHRVGIVHGDLRDEAVLARLGTGFDLVTGTPPYFPPDAALDAMDEQRAYARIEYRGGVETYLAAGARTLSARGVMVVCGDARASGRVDEGARAAGLALVARVDIVAQEGKSPLFSIWSAMRASSGGAIATSALTLRDAAGKSTADAAALRAFSGFPPRGGPSA